MEQRTREEVLAPFDQNPNWDGGLVISPDWDGLLSAAIVCHHYDHASVVGFYDPNLARNRSVVYLSEELATSSEGDVFEPLGRTVWLDHDIFDSRIISIGQHMIRHRNGGEGDIVPEAHQYSRNTLSFNPHDIRGFGWDPVGLNTRCQGTYSPSGNPCRRRMYTGETMCLSHGGHGAPTVAELEADRTFRRKYPFATVHILIAALGMPEDVEPTESLRMAFSHADSAGIAASQRARNSLDWHDSFSPACEFTEIISGSSAVHTSSLGGLSRHIEFVMNLQELGIIDMRSDPMSQFESDLDHMNILAKGLTGKYKQRIPSESLLDDDYLTRMQESVLDLLGLRIRFSRKFVEVMQGVPASLSQKDDLITPGWDFSQWLAENQVFSLAFTSNAKLRYTSNMQQI